MEKSLPALVLIVSTCLTCGCSDAVRDWVISGSGDPPNTTEPSTTPADAILPTDFSWEFIDSSNYTYDSSYIEVLNGTASLKVAKQSHSGVEFNSGIHMGTFVSESGSLSLQGKVNSQLSVSSILPAKASSLVGYWQFDGDLLDSSTNNSAGNIVNTPGALVIESKIGSGSFNFTGNAVSYIDTGTSILPLITDNFTISAWVKPSSVGSAMGIAGRARITTSHGFFIATDLSSKFSLNSYNNGAVTKILSDELFIPDVWYHLVATSTNGTQYLYVNGVKQTVSSSVSISSSDLPFTIGRSFANFGNDSFLGLIDEVAIFNASLSASEILFLYNSQSSSFRELDASWTPQWDNIVGYWKMDGNWSDASGHGNTGIAMNGANFSPFASIGSYSGNFDGIDDYIDISNSFNLNTISVSLWARPSSRAPGEAVISTPSNFIQFGGGGSTPWQFSCAIGPAPTLGDWTHVTITQGGGTSKLYIDGDLYSSASCSSLWTTLNIGRRTDGIYFDGRIDDLAIWSIELTAAEVSAIYYRQKNKDIFYGYYDSPILDLGRTASWTSLAPATTLPFSKELADPNTNESSADYSLMVGNLTMGLLGYWPLNE